MDVTRTATDGLGGVNGHRIVNFCDSMQRVIVDSFRFPNDLLLFLRSTSCGTLGVQQSCPDES